MRSQFGFHPHMRMRSGSHFQRAYTSGSRARGAILVVVACENGLEVSRLGLSIGKRIWKSAVRRNRIRRIFREAFRLSHPQLPVGYDFVLIAAEPKLEPQLEATCKELVHLAKKAERRLLEKRAKESAAEQA